LNPGKIIELHQQENAEFIANEIATWVWEIKGRNEMVANHN